jgi:protein-tyrosine phosphatase
LFLCTGNYYRSRFAELLFDALVAENGLNWQADSRGVATEFGVNNVGPMSPHALRGLAARGITVAEPIRFPLHLQEQDLQQADLIVALKEAEHRPLMEARFPPWADEVEYWHVDDLDCATAEEALPEIEHLVRGLIRQLEDNGGTP